MHLSRRRKEFLDEMPSKRGWVVPPDETYPALAKRGLKKGGRIAGRIAGNAGLIKTSRKEKKGKSKGKRGNPFNIMGW